MIPIPDPPRHSHVLSYRLLATVVAGSLFLGLVFSACQILISHRRGLKEMESTIDLIRTTHLPAIASSLFAINEEQLRLQLEGIVNLSAIRFAEVREDRAKFHIAVTVGSPP